MNMWFQFLDNWLRGASAVRIAGIGAFFVFAAWVFYAIGMSGLGRETESDRQVAEAAPLVIDEYEETAPAARAEPSHAEASVAPRGEAELPEPPMAIDLQRTIRDSRMKGLVGRLMQVLPQLEKWELRREEWEALRPELLEGDLGRPLAADAARVPQMVQLVSQADRLATQSENLRGQYDAVLEAIGVNSDNGGGGVLTEESEDEVKEICSEILSASAKFDGVIQAIRREIDSASASNATGLTLDQAFGEHHANEASLEAEATVAAKLAAKEAMVERIRAAEREVAESEVRLRLAQLKAEADRIKGEEDVARAEAAKRKEEDEARLRRAKLETDFAQDQAEIQSLLSPFVSRAQYILTPPNSHLYSGQNAGVSLSAIAKFGALEPTDEGVDAMSQLGQTAYRPLGSFPKYVQSEWRRSPEVRRRLERAQELLLKYGELLVEKGMLEK